MSTKFKSSSVDVIYDEYSYVDPKWYPDLTGVVKEYVSWEEYLEATRDSDGEA